MTLAQLVRYAGTLDPRLQSLNHSIPDIYLARSDLRPRTRHTGHVCGGRLSGNVGVNGLIHATSEKRAGVSKGAAAPLAVRWVQGGSPGGVRGGAPRRKF